MRSSTPPLIRQPPKLSRVRPQSHGQFDPGPLTLRRAHIRRRIELPDCGSWSDRQRTYLSQLDSIDLSPGRLPQFVEATLKVSRSWSWDLPDTKPVDSTSHLPGICIASPEHDSTSAGGMVCVDSSSLPCASRTTSATSEPIANIIPPIADDILGLEESDSEEEAELFDLADTICKVAPEVTNNDDTGDTGDGIITCSTSSCTESDNSGIKSASSDICGKLYSLTEDEAKDYKSVCIENDSALRYAFEWDRHLVSCLTSDERRTMVNSMSGATWSTCFSGICGPGAALQDLLAEVKQCNEYREDSFVAPKLTSMVEWEPWEQKELSTLHCGNSCDCDVVGDPSSPCLFGDVAGFFTDNVKRLIPNYMQNPEKIVPSLMPLLIAGVLVELDAAFCKVHKAKCRLISSCYHFAGFPCTAHSSLGTKLMWRDPTMIFVMAWAGIVLLAQHAVICVENVPGVEYIITACFRRFYLIDDKSYVLPTTFGFKINRTREYFILRHELKCGALVSPLSRFQQRFRRAAKGTMYQFLWIDRDDCGDYRNTVIPNEISTELSWASSRPTSRARIHRLETAHMKSIQQLRPASSSSSAPLYRSPSVWELCLNQLEAAFLGGFRDLAPASGKRCGMWSLQQNPHKVVIRSCGETMGCMIKSMHFQWVERNPRAGLIEARWVQGSEALTAQGFRVRPMLRKSGAPRQSSFNLEIRGRTGTKVREGVGNSMCVPCVGACWAHMFINISFIDEPDEPSDDPTTPSFELAGLFGQL